MAAEGFYGGTDTDDLQPDAFFKGLSYLGKPATITLPGQEPSPPGGGPSLGAAGGPALSTPSVTGTPGVGPEPSGAPTSALSPGLRALLTGASFGSRFSSLANDLLGSSVAGAFQTPSGQLTTSAPEILRELQFPSEAGQATPVADAIGAATPAGAAPSPLGDLAGQVGGYIGQALPYAPAALGLIQGIIGRDPTAITGSVEQGALTGLGEAGLGLIPSGAAAPIAAAASIITNIIADEIRDPQGRRSAAEDARFLMSQEVPGEAQGLQLGAAILPLISDRLTTDQAMQLYGFARNALKDSELLAQPIASQGQQEAGVHFPTYEGLNAAVNQYAPQAWLATVRLQDLLARRGVSDPAAAPFTVPAGPGTIYGTPTAQQLTPEQAAFEPVAFPFGREGVEQQVPGGTLYLTPQEALGKIGHYGGFTEAPYSETAAGIGTAGGGYQYSPATMQKLAGIQPGGLESGLQGYLSTLPGYANSPLAALLAAQQGGAAQAGAPQDQQAAGQPGAVSYPSSITSGEEFPFQYV